MSAGYETVFEISQKGFTWWFALVGLVPAIPGVALWWWSKSHKVSWRAIWISYAFTVFALFWLCICSIPMAVTYRHLLSAYRSGRYSTVEGRVEDFHPMAPQGHSAECFRVQTATFCYGDNIISPGFNHDTAHGGPIRENLPVRVEYIGNDILRLEVNRTDFINPDRR
jgi:hypothetical protein